MRIAARFRLPSGEEVELEPGDIVGRMPRCDLRIEDPRISEAHALVSLRGPTLKLLVLRGRISVGGKTVTEVALSAGQRFLLGGFYPLIVTSFSVNVCATVGCGPTSCGPIAAASSSSTSARATPLRTVRDTRRGHELGRPCIFPTRSRLGPSLDFRTS